MIKGYLANQPGDTNITIFEFRLLDFYILKQGKDLNFHYLDSAILSIFS